MDKHIQDVNDSVLNGNKYEIKQNVQTALEKSVSAEELLNMGHIAAMKEVGQLFKDGKYFIPEMLISSSALQFMPLLVSKCKVVFV